MAKKRTLEPEGDDAGKRVETRVEPTGRPEFSDLLANKVLDQLDLTSIASKLAPDLAARLVGTIQLDVLGDRVFENSSTAWRMTRSSRRRSRPRCRGSWVGESSGSFPNPEKLGRPRTSRAPSADVDLHERPELSLQGVEGFRRPVLSLGPRRLPRGVPGAAICLGGATKGGIRVTPPRGAERL